MTLFFYFSSYTSCVRYGLLSMMCLTLAYFVVPKFTPVWQCHWLSPIIPCLTLLQVFGWCLPPPILLPLCQLCLMFCRYSHLYLTFSLEKCLPRALKCSQNSYVDTLFPSVMIFGDRVLMRLSSHDGICALIRKRHEKKTSHFPSFSSL